MYAIIALIAFLATLLGAVFGIGGGVIIKPALEAATGLALAHSNALSGLTVLCMAAVSLARYLKGGMRPDRKLIALSLGAVGGGFLGKYFFDLMRLALPENHAKLLQYALLIALLGLALFKKKLKSLDIQHAAALVLAGLFMGTLSAFLGIGGGPINLLVIYVVLGLDAKQAAVYSVFVILCSQLSMAGTSIASGAYAGLDLRPLMVMLPAAVAGGLIGPVFHKKWEIARFERYYNWLLWALIALNAYNIIAIVR